MRSGNASRGVTVVPTAVLADPSRPPVAVKPVQRTDRRTLGFRAQNDLNGVITASGRQLELDGQPYNFVGVNAYELATDWGVNYGCGPMLTDAQLDAFFASLRPNSLVRFWAFEGSMAINIQTGQIDWAPLDRVFAAASAYHQRLIVSLTDQGGACDGNEWYDPTWYLGGFRSPRVDVENPVGPATLMPLSYWDYMQAIVERYRNAPALGMWEPISEAEASTCPAQFEPTGCGGHQTCPDEAAAALALRYFFDVVGKEIHTLDPDHLVESGLLGSGQCGTQGRDYEYVSASPGIDVLSYHDYYPATQVMGGDQWNGLAVRLQQAAALNKPIIAGETGIVAGPAAGCLSLGQRATDFANRIEAQLQAGSSGVLIWDWFPQQTSDCDLQTYPGDPLLTVLYNIDVNGV
ncbi:MAG: beta-mannosidase [Acidimicrobiales bacterium]